MSKFYFEAFEGALLSIMLYKYFETMKTGFSLTRQNYQYLASLK